MVDALVERGLAGWTLLEIGGGAGGSVVTLLESGVGRATVFDLSPASEQVAGELVTERGLTGRVTWHTGDFLRLAHQTATADLVFLNRVVCCYPDMPHLVDAAAGRAMRCLAMSFPRDRMSTRIGVRFLNGYLRMRRSSFRVFVHDVGAILDRIAAAGFTEFASGTSPVWEWHLWEKG
jgi:hypothetical protein